MPPGFWCSRWQSSFSSIVRADTPKVLSGHEITERNKPGVIKIESSWQTKFAVWDPKIKDVDQLEKRIESQVRAGLVPADSNDIKKAMLAEIATHFDQYLTRSTNGFIEEEPLVCQGILDYHHAGWLYRYQ